jgi:twinkle protein
MSPVTVTGSPVRLKNRGISEATCRKFKCHLDGTKLRFYYYENKKVIGCKTKTTDKTFRYEGKATNHLWGRQLWPDSGKRIVITEGEIDCLSYAEVQPSWPVVSLPTGAASAKKSLQANLGFLQGYEEIVLAFDNDDAGRKAAEEACEVLPLGKVKIAKLPDKFKDFSDALQINAVEDIKKAVWDAEAYRPDGIIDAKNLLSTLLEDPPSALFTYRFAGVQQKLHGIRRGELITITAGTGIGKSSLCRQFACHVLEDGGRVGYLALEEHYRTTLLGLISASLGKNYLTKPYDKEEMMQAYDATVANWDLQLFDGFGSYSPDEIYKRIEYMILGLGCQVVFFDHLSILLSGLTDIDERRSIDIVMTRLRSLVEATGVTLFLLCHVSGDDNGKPYEEGGRVKLNKLRGSRAIGQISDIVIALERDQQCDQHSNRSLVRILKNRFSGEVGPACYLTYNKDDSQFTESAYYCNTPDGNTSDTPLPEF